MVALSLLVAVSSCSWVLDFPDVGSGTGATSGGTTTTGAGGGPCDPGTTVAPPPELVWHGTSPNGNDSDSVHVSGLARVGDELDVWGTNFNGIQNFPNLSPGAANIVYLLSFKDSGPVDVIGYGTACTSLNGYFTTGRMGLLNGRPLVSFVVPTANPPSMAAFGLGTADPCATGTMFYPKSASTPVNAYFSATTVSLEDAGDGLGSSIDVAANAKGDAAGLQVLRGSAWGNTAPDELTFWYYMLRSDASSSSQGLLMTEIANEAQVGGAFVPYGGVAVDDGGGVWSTGMACAAPGNCTGAAFVSSWPAGEGTTETHVTVNSPNASFGSVIRYAGGRVVVGGAYVGSFAVGGAALPAASDTDQFVAAIDPATRQALWTYPTTTELARPAFDAVVDVAAVGTPGCGAVYVLACGADPTSATQDCLGLDNGKRAFLTKLDLGTGAQVWTTEIATEAPTDNYIVPRAVAADDTGVWAAFSYRGTVNVGGTAIVSNNLSVDTLILKFAR
ncbi:MAG: hypothetical protein U0414_06000 [Polyangiaceae bacterium]